MTEPTVDQFGGQNSSQQQCRLVETPDSIPKGKKGHQRNCKYSYKTATADLVIGKVTKNKKVCSVIYINNSKEGNGNASKLMKYIQGYAGQCRCNQIWYPTVLNSKLVMMLIKRGYKLQFHKDELFGEVEVFVKDI